MKKPMAIMLAAVALAAVSAKAHDEHDHDQHDVIRQDAAAGLEADIALVVEETGLAKEEVRRAIAFQQSFAKYAQEMLARFPDQISAIWTEPMPGQKGYIRFTGAAPREARPANVVLLEGGELSLAESYRRAELAAEALKQDGYRNFLTFFDQEAQVIRVEMKLPQDAPEPSKSDVLHSVQEYVFEQLSLSGKALVVGASDLELTLIRGAGEIYTLEHSRGGNWVLDDGFRECTSGWAVNGSNGNGIMTAAHCTGLNQFEEPGVTPYPMTFIRQHRGTNGDVEYHTTTHIELPEFYATATSIRDVNSIRATNTMVGSTVCVYGRSSNLRSCAHSVEAVNLTVTFTDGVTVGSLARASGDTSIGGDSGGGWSFNFEAWGVHSGSNGTQSFFTPVQEAQSAIGVTLLLN